MRYRLIIGCNSWVGNFERELIGYSTGLMSQDMKETSCPGEYCTDFYIREVLNKRELDDFLSTEDTELGKYFVYYIRDFGDFAGYSFYSIINGNLVEEAKSDSYIVIPLTKLLDIESESLIVSRIKQFFEVNPDNCLTDESTKLTELFIEDLSDSVVKDYLH